ncbi:MAG: hypothetical protein A2W25_00875 [candidate division Zixibacteria bacterium RBG_16_53_22]|nr:MAG: hypothetical protein A2W25_00875 [candidate division Zixibacteria bacterium RBG_16_53_22]
MRTVTILLLAVMAAIPALAQYPVVPIDSIQTVPCNRDSSLLAGDTVITGGLITAGTGTFYAGAGVTFYMEDPAGGPFSGIMAYEPNAQGYPDLFPGDSILCTALVSEYVSTGPPFVVMTELFIVPGTFQFRGYGMPQPNPIDVLATEIDSTGGADSCGEKYEGVFVRVHSLTVDTVINYTTTSVWICHDSLGGTCFVREASDSIPNSYRPAVGTQYDFVQGVIYHRFGAYHLQPRYMRDMRLLGGFPSVTTYHSPQFPLVGDTVTITATVVDDHPIPAGNVRLFYRINLGGWTNVPMQPGENDQYIFRLPSPVAGWKVDYYVQATDDENHTTRDPYEAPFTFFEYSVQLAREMTIAQARIDANADFLPDLLDSAVIVRGIAISPNFSSGTYSSFFMQQDTAGIQVYFGSAQITVNPGDSIMANGVIDQISGVTEVHVYRGSRLANYGPSGHVPAPRVLTCANLGDIDGEAYEGTLVRVNDVLILEIPNPWPPLGSSATMTIVDSDTATLRIDRSTDIDGQPQAEPRADIVGVVSQYDNYDPYLGYYQLMPRYYTDFTWRPVNVADDGILPNSHVLNQNYPNPFNPSTKISFSLIRRGNVTLSVYNLLGQKVLELVNQELEAGAHEVEWDGRDRSGKPVSSGLYFYKMQAGDFIDTKMMTLLK